MKGEDSGESEHSPLVTLLEELQSYYIREKPGPGEMGDPLEKSAGLFMVSGGHVMSASSTQTMANFAEDVERFNSSVINEFSNIQSNFFMIERVLNALIERHKKLDRIFELFEVVMSDYSRTFEIRPTGCRDSSEPTGKSDSD